MEETALSQTNRHQSDRPTIHKAVLCKTSKFLRAALKPEWQGPEPRPVDLTDEDPVQFGMYLCWLYTGKLPVQPLAKLPNDDKHQEDYHMPSTSYLALARAFVLGAKLMDSAFQNHILKVFIDCVECDGLVPHNEVVRIIYGGTEADSPARKLMVDFWVGETEDMCEENDRVVDTVGVDFANDLILALFAQRAKPYSKDGKNKPWIKEPMQYRIKDD